MQRSDSEYEFKTYISVDLNGKYIRKTKQPEADLNP